MNKQRAADQSRHASIGPCDIRERMSLLALSFPTLRDDVPGVAPWDAWLIDDWAATSGAATSGSLCAVQFLLYVWDPSADWRCGDFSLRDAYGVWDMAHWQVLQRFIQCPFFP